jgi:2-hydroxy-6-oxonona-2,4-dienedioate hydrolase
VAASITPPDRGLTYRSVWRDLMDTPFEQGFIDAGGVRTRFVHAGDPAAPVVLMVHGTGGSWETFCSNIGPISKAFNVYAIDTLGGGYTGKPDFPYEIPRYVEHFVDFMDAMGIRRASLIGCSLGAWSACRLAVDHPGRVDKLILISVGGLKSLPAAERQGLESRRTSVQDPTWDSVSDVVSRLVYSGKMADDLIAVRQKIYMQPEMRDAMKHLLALTDPEIRERNNLKPDEWRSIKAPTLVIAHKDSPDMWLETSYEVAQLIPHAQLVEIGETSHWSHFEKPALFNQLALDFLKG